MINKDAVFASLLIIGVVFAVAGLLINWATISITMTDGSVETFKYTGLEVYLDIDSNSTPISTFVPLVFMLITFMDVTMVLLMKRVETDPAIPLFVLFMSFTVMYIAGAGTIDSALYWNDSPLSTVHSVPDWISNLTTNDVRSANISSGKGYQLSLLGILIIWAGVIMDVRKNKKVSKTESS